MKIVLTKEQYDRRPFKSSNRTKALTKGDIMGLLEDKGVTDMAFMKDPGEEGEFLVFKVSFTIQGIKRTFSVRLDVPRIYYMKPIRAGRNAPKQETYLEKESWRCLYWHLRNKLLALEYGAEEWIQLFAAEVLFKLTDDSQATVGEALSNLFMDEEKFTRLGALMLEDKRGK